MAKKPTTDEDTGSTLDEEGPIEEEEGPTEEEPILDPPPVDPAIEEAINAMPTVTFESRIALPTSRCFLRSLDAEQLLASPESAVVYAKIDEPGIAILELTAYNGPGYTVQLPIDVITALAQCAIEPRPEPEEETQEEDTE